MASGLVPKTDMILIFFMMFFLYMFLLGLLFENDPQPDGADDDDGTNENQGAEFAGGGQQNSSQTQDRGQHIGNGNRLLLVEAHINEPMMDMTAVCHHGILTLGDPTQECKANVKNGNA